MLFKSHTQIYTFMPIYAIQGDILNVAPQKSESIAIWMCSGFNSRNSIWRYELKNRGFMPRLVHPSNRVVSKKVLNSAFDTDSKNEPWMLAHETLWKLSGPNLGELKYIYVFPNPEDKQALNSLSDLEISINICMQTLTNFDIKSVSFILVPSIMHVHSEKHVNDLESAKNMIFSLQNWLIKNKSDIDVYLVDRGNGFVNLLNN